MISNITKDEENSKITEVCLSILGKEMEKQGLSSHLCGHSF